jgi:argininosuccinate lyase
MQPEGRSKRRTLTGRLQTGPATLLHEEILEPQFNYELQHLLNWYIWIEKVLLLEYKRMGLLEDEYAIKIASILHQITPNSLVADPGTNMSDIAFAIEQHVAQQLQPNERMSAWHVDRSRNDLQACAQLLFARDQLLELVDDLFAFAQAIHTLSQATTDIVMPGYTHYQAAQVISPGFYLAALSEHVLGTLQRLLAIYDNLNKCSLGAGAMAGQQLPWHRSNMAKLLGFAGPQHHALLAVASKEWTLLLAGELATFGTTLSRFVTDFIAWGSSAYGFIDLPDELSAISSAMPQKKNFPILERIRGKTAHLFAFYSDFLTGQRSTAYTNLVEVSKEAGTHLLPLFMTTRSMLHLFTLFIEQVHFLPDRMRAACEREFLGGFSLANFLTLHQHIPYRTAQVIAGKYIVAAMKRELQPSQVDTTILQSLCQQHGYDAQISDEELGEIFNVEQNLRRMQSLGATAPAAVQKLLDDQKEEISQVRATWQQRRKAVELAYQEVNILLGC